MNINTKSELAAIESNLEISITEFSNDSPTIQGICNLYYRLELITILRRLALVSSDPESLERIDKLIDQIKILNIETRQKIDSSVIGNEKIPINTQHLISIYQNLLLFPGNEIKLAKVKAQIRAIDNFFNIIERRI